MGDEQQIVPGISLNPSGEATVDPALADVLFDLAIQLEDSTNLPVDNGLFDDGLVLSHLAALFFAPDHRRFAAMSANRGWLYEFR